MASVRLRNSFPSRLIRARKAADMTQLELAKAILVAQSVISKFEAGDLEPRLSMVRELALVLRVPPLYFLRDGESEQTRQEDHLIGYFSALPRSQRTLLLRLAKSLHESQELSLENSLDAMAHLTPYEWGELANDPITLLSQVLLMIFKALQGNTDQRARLRASLVEDGRWLFLLRALLQREKWEHDP
jgi:transcriptional regulator with XRE-family HTH domain